MRMTSSRWLGCDIKRCGAGLDVYKDEITMEEYDRFYGVERK